MSFLPSILPPPLFPSFFPSDLPTRGILVACILQAAVVGAWMTWVLDVWMG